MNYHQPRAPIDYSHCKTIFAVTEQVHLDAPRFTRDHCWDGLTDPYVCPRLLIGVLNKAAKPAEGVGHYVIVDPTERHQ